MSIIRTEIEKLRLKTSNQLHGLVYQRLYVKVSQLYLVECSI